MLEPQTQLMLFGASHSRSACSSPHFRCAARRRDSLVRLTRHPVNPNSEAVAEPCGEAMDEALIEVTAKAWTPLLQRVIRATRWNLRNLQSVSAKVKEMPGDQCESTINKDTGPPCVNSLSLISAAVVRQRQLFVYAHCINELPDSSALTAPESRSAPGTDNPVAILCELDYVRLFRRAIFALGQRAEPAERIGRESIVMIDNVAEQPGHLRLTASQ
jgi:hypothetical protein